MAICRVFQQADGSLVIAHGKDLEQMTKQLTHLKGLLYIDVDDSTLPKDEESRHAWRIAGLGVSVDTSVRRAKTNKEQCLDMLKKAETFEDIKRALEKYIE